MTEETLNTGPIMHTGETKTCGTGEKNQFGKEGFCEVCNLVEGVRTYHGTVNKFGSWWDLEVWLTQVEQVTDQRHSGHSR